MKGNLEMFDQILKLAGLIVTTISMIVKVIDLVQQWKDKRASKKQPPRPR